MLFLTEPSETYKDSYIQAVQEFQDEGRHQEESVKSLTKDFEGFIRFLHDQKS